jgi:hypothetical protein
VADAFSKSATAKIEAAGGTAQVLEFPTVDDGESDETAIPAPSAVPAAPTAEKAKSPATTAETLPPTSPADEADSEA